MLLVLHNGGSDLAKLVQAGIKLPNARFWDTFVAARWCWPDAYDNSLEHLALRLTDMPQWRPYGKLDAEDFDTMSDDALAKRCGGDAEATLRLYPRLLEEIKALRLEKIFGLAMDVLPILAEMGGRGMAVDIDELERRMLGKDSKGEGLVGQKPGSKKKRKILKKPSGSKISEADKNLALSFLENLGQTLSEKQLKDIRLTGLASCGHVIRQIKLNKLTFVYCSHGCSFTVLY